MSPTVNAPLTAPTAPTGFEIRIEFAGQVPLLAVDGDLDLATAPLLKRQLGQLLGAGYERVLLDFSNVSFIDSTAIGVLVGAARRFSHDRLVLAGCPPAVRAVFAACGLEHRFPHYPSPPAALAAFTQPSGGDRSVG